MFLAETNMAEYASHRKFKCPVLFGITNNEICISLKGYDWLDTFQKKFQMPVFKADGRNLLDMYRVSHEAQEFVRRKKKPAVLVVDQVPRRFGHAATDRQAA